MKKALLILSVILLVLLVGCGSETVITDCDGYSKLKNYTSSGETVYFAKNDAKISYVVLDNQCNNLKSDFSKYVFENYFTIQYVSATNKLPSKLTEVNDATKVIIRLLDEPFKEIDLGSLDGRKQNVVLYLSSQDLSKRVKEMEIISENYNSMYFYAKSSYVDQTLSAAEMDLYQNKTAEFIFTFLEETKTTKKVLKKLSPNPWTDFVLTLDWVLKKISPAYESKREAKAVDILKQALFKKPSKFVYSNFYG